MLKKRRRKKIKIIKIIKKLTNIASQYRNSNSHHFLLEWLIQAALLCFIILNPCARNTEADQRAIANLAEVRGIQKKKCEGPGWVYVLGRLQRSGREKQQSSVQLQFQGSTANGQKAEEASNPLHSMVGAQMSLVRLQRSLLHWLFHGGS